MSGFSNAQTFLRRCKPPGPRADQSRSEAAHLVGACPSAVPGLRRPPASALVLCPHAGGVVNASPQVLFFQHTL